MARARATELKIITQTMIPIQSIGFGLVVDNEQPPTTLRRPSKVAVVAAATTALARSLHLGHCSRRQLLLPNCETRTAIATGDYECKCDCSDGCITTQLADWQDNGQAAASGKQLAARVRVLAPPPVKFEPKFWETEAAACGRADERTTLKLSVDNDDDAASGS